MSKTLSLIVPPIPTWKAWVYAVRLKTLSASIVPTLCGAILSLEYFPIQVFQTVLLMLYALSLQILSNLSNDYCDHLRGVDTLERVGPLRMTSSGLISLQQMKSAILLNIFVILGLGLYLAVLSSVWIFVVTLLAIAAAYL